MRSTLQFIKLLPFAVSCRMSPASESRLEGYCPHFVADNDIDRGDHNC